MISIQVRYFASMREQRGCSSEQVQLASGSTARDLGRQLRIKDKTCKVAVNHEYVQLDDPLHDGDEVAFFPPVTGG